MQSQLELEPFDFLPPFLPHPVDLQRGLVGDWSLRAHIDGFLTLFLGSGSQLIKLLSGLGQLLLALLPQLAFILHCRPQLLPLERGCVEFLLQAGQSLILAAHLPSNFPQFLPQVHALRPHSLVLLRQSFILLGDEAHGVLDPHELIVLLLDEFAAGVLLLLLGSLLLVEAQLGQAHLVGDPLLHAQDEVLVLARLVLGLTRGPPRLFARPLALQLQARPLARGSGLLHLDELHAGAGARLPPLNAFVEGLLLAREVLHQPALALPHLLELAPVGGLHLARVGLELYSPLLPHAHLDLVRLELPEPPHLLLEPRLLLCAAVPAP